MNYEEQLTEVLELIPSVVDKGSNYMTDVISRAIDYFLIINSIKVLVLSILIGVLIYIFFYIRNIIIDYNDDDTMGWFYISAGIISIPLSVVLITEIFDSIDNIVKLINIPEFFIYQELVKLS